MAIITDPDNLLDSALDNASTNFHINTSTKTLKLVPGQGGLVAADGVTEKAVYSFLKEEWTNDPLSKNLAAFDFPMAPITDEFFELINGWTWADTTTEQTIRRGGWLVRNVAGNVTEHWAGTAILNAQPDDQITFELGIDGAVSYTFPGNTAEAIQVISDPNGDGSYVDGYNNSGNVVVRNREQGQLYSSSSASGIGENSLLAPKLFSFSLPTGDDLNIAESDANIATQLPYTGMSIEFFSTPQSRNIGGQSRNFGIIIDGNNGTKKQIYEFVQWSLRQATDQDAGAGTLVGNVMPELLEFVGTTLKTKTATNYQGGGTGVYIDNFSAVDTNDLVFVDNTGTERTFPFVAAGEIPSNTNLTNDSNPKFFVYYKDGVDAGLEYGNSTAILVEDNSGNPLTGDITGSPIPFDYDYDGNNQGNRTPGTPANIVAIAIGLDTGQYVKVETTINRTNSNTISFVAALERQYENS